MMRLSNRKFAVSGSALVLILGWSGLVLAAAPAGDPYPLDRCPVSGEKLGSMGDPVSYNYQGRDIKFCCQGCVANFEKDPETYLKKADAEIAEQQKAHYPLDTCVVSGEKLGSGGMSPVDKVYGNRLVRFCCGACPAQFESDPQKYLSKLDEAVIARQKENYPLENCVVSGQKLGSMGEPLDKVYGDRLVRFCCKGCVAKFEANPTQYLEKIDKAMEEKKEHK